MRRRSVFCHMLIPKEDPLHLVWVHALGALQDAAYPHSWRQGIAAHPDAAPV